MHFEIQNFGPFLEEKIYLVWSSLKDICKKIEIYNAVIKAKLLYGLETTQLTKGSKRDLDVFQKRGLRKNGARTPLPHPEN